MSVVETQASRPPRFMKSSVCRLLLVSIRRDASTAGFAANAQPSAQREAARYAVDQRITFETKCPVTSYDFKGANFTQTGMDTFTSSPALDNSPVAGSILNVTML